MHRGGDRERVSSDLIAVDVELIIKRSLLEHEEQVRIDLITIQIASNTFITLFYYMIIKIRLSLDQFADICFCPSQCTVNIHRCEDR